VANFIGECNQPQAGWGQIEVWRTDDGGEKWHGPVVVSRDVTFITNPSNPNCGQSGVIQGGAQPAIGPNGEVYVVWRWGPRIELNSVSSTKVQMRIARSLNYGRSFEPPVIVTSKEWLGFNPPAGYNRPNGLPDHPRIAVVMSGPHKGRVYVVFAIPTHT